MIEATSPDVAASSVPSPASARVAKGDVRVDRDAFVPSWKPWPFPARLAVFFPQHVWEGWIWPEEAWAHKGGGRIKSFVSAILRKRTGLFSARDGPREWGD